MLSWIVTGVVLVPANMTSFAVPGFVSHTTASFAPLVPGAVGLGSLIFAKPTSPLTVASAVPPNCVPPTKASCLRHLVLECNERKLLPMPVTFMTAVRFTLKFACQTMTDIR